MSTAWCIVVCTAIVCASALAGMAWLALCFWWVARKMEKEAKEDAR